MRGVAEQELADAAQLASLADETPEGRSIVVLAKEKFGIRAPRHGELHATFVPFTAQTRMSGVDLDGCVDPQGRGRCRHRLRLAADRRPAAERGPAPTARRRTEPCARSGRSPRRSPRPAARRWRSPTDGRLLGVVHLKDIVKGGIRERFAELRRMGIRTVMITGDNPLTAAAIAAEAGVDDFLAQATPEAKLALIRKEQAKGKLVAMCGDGTNDAPALAQADVGVAMNTGTVAAREAGNMVDLDCDPTKLIEIVEIGKQLLMTRGALTTFSIANDVAKYFAIIPAMFVGASTRSCRRSTSWPRHAAERDPVGDHLQRADHHRADPAGAAGVHLPPGRGGRAPAAQPPDLRPRRHHRALRRHQGHRPRRHRPRPRLRRSRPCSSIFAPPSSSSSP